MKYLLFVLTTLMIFQIDGSVFAQGQRGGQRPGGNAGRGQVPPLFMIFDVDGSGELSSEEISNASKALNKLDRNNDGRLTPDEFRSAMGGRGGQAQGRGIQGGQRGGSQGGGRSGGSRGGAMQGGRPGGGQQRGRAGSGGPGGQAGGRRGDSASADAQFAKQIMELDSNRNNQISIDELPEHMHAAFKIADTDQNGEVNAKELLVLAGEFRRNKLNPDGENLEMKNRPTGGAPNRR